MSVKSPDFIIDSVGKCVERSNLRFFDISLPLSLFGIYLAIFLGLAHSAIHGKTSISNY